MSDTRLIDFGEIPEHIERPVPSSRRQVLCSFFSAMLPGVGFWFLGARTKAVITLGLFLLVFSMFWPMGLTRNYVIWIVCSCGLIVVYLAGAGLTLLSTTPLGKKRPSLLWLLVVLPLAFLVGSISLQLAVFAAGMRPFEMAGESMEPTLFLADGVMFDMRFYRNHEPIAKDVLVFRHHGLFLTKRLLATGGDTLSSKDGIIKVNGTLLDEPYATHAGDAPEEANTFGPIKIPEGYFFVLGDNRDRSLDSRFAEFGLVAKQDVLGRALFVYKSKHDQTGRTLR